MGRKKKKQPPEGYGEWLEEKFARLPAEYDDETATAQGREPSEEIACITHMLSNCGDDLTEFTDQQVGLGLDAMFNSSLSDDALIIVRDDGDIAAQARLIAEFGTLYRNCLAPRCPDVLGHRSEGRGALSMFCYMLWDTSIVGYWQATKKNQPRVDALFKALEAGLACNHHGCMESALHGIGHLHGSMIERGRETVNRFLERKGKTIRPELARYAENAALQIVQ